MQAFMEVGSRIQVPISAGQMITSSDPHVIEVHTQGKVITVEAINIGLCTLAVTDKSPTTLKIAVNVIRT
jgi:hypothetical protein